MSFVAFSSVHCVTVHLFSTTFLSLTLCVRFEFLYMSFVASSSVDFVTVHFFSTTFLSLISRFSFGKWFFCYVVQHTSIRNFSGQKKFVNAFCSNFGWFNGKLVCKVLLVHVVLECLR
jgi:hypothetical protein